MCSITGLARALILCLFAGLSCASQSRECIAADGPQQRSILVLEEADFRSPFYSEIFAGIRAAAKQNGKEHTVIYGESLDLARFPGPDYEESLVGHLKTKYAHRPIDVIVSIGVASAKFLQKRKQDIWPAAPVVYGFVPDLPETRALFLPDTTAVFARVRPMHLLTAARAIVPDLSTVVLVGDAWRNPLVYGYWKQDFAAAMPGLEVIDLSDAVLREVRQRVASLPARSAILTSAMYSDGEAPSSIAPFDGTNVKPIFDWRELKRWNVDEANLPAGSEIRFRELSFWQQYYWHSMIVASVVLVQALLISILLRERRLRFVAEVEARQRMSELAHMNRRATAGEMTASIAHELNQPLAAILINAETAQQMLKNPAPDLGEVRDILDHIRRDDQRAAEVIGRLRAFLKRDPTERRELELNATVGEVFRFLSVQALTHDVELATESSSADIRVKGDKVQLQQAILNLVVNGMDAVAHLPDDRRRVVGRTSVAEGNLAVVSIADTGDGILAEKVSEIFKPFFTTKAQGMGIGLSIAHTIVEAHGGRIWVENAPSGGAVFHVSLPLAAPR